MTFKNIVSKIRRYGLYGFLYRCTTKAWELMSGRRHNPMQLLGLDIPKDISMPESRIQLLTLDDFEIQRQLNHPTECWFTPVKMEKIKRYLAHPEVEAYGIMVEDRIVSYGCIRFGSCNVIGTALNDSDVYLFDDYTHPGYRGQGLHDEMIRYRLAIAKERGCRRAFSMVARFNRASRSNYIKAGFQVVRV